MSSSPWSWDAIRSLYYRWVPEENSYVSQDGSRVPFTSKASESSRGIPTYGASEKPLSRREELDPKYKIRRGPVDFFKPGRVFKFLWPELHETKYVSGTSNIRRRRQWEIPGTIGGIPTAAFPDTGSSRDVLSLDFVKKYFPTHAIKSGSKCDIKIPNGNIIRSLGELQLPFQFEGESMAHIRSFAVLPTCLHDVVLGRTFLRLTQTMTHFQNRLREKLVSHLSTRKMHLIGRPNEAIVGQIDGYLTSACPDTGSDIMAISSSFAKQRGYHVDDSSENKIQVQFADGSFGQTYGKVSNVDWKFGHRKDTSDSFKVEFYVLDELPYDAILSNEFLFDNDVFGRFEKHFVQCEGVEDAVDNFYLIQRVSWSLLNQAKRVLRREPPLVTVTPAQLLADEKEDAEMHRRAQADQTIRSLPPEERRAARNVETSLREQYDLNNPPILR